MAAAPKYKVYSESGAYQGCAKDAVLAAVMADFVGEGATVRTAHSPKSTVFCINGYNQGSWDEIAESIANEELAQRQARQVNSAQ